MTRSYKLLLNLLTLFLLCLHTLAQSEAPSKSTVKVRTVEISILLRQSDGALVPVDSKKDFRAGDQVRIELKSNFSGYLYIVNHGTSGKKQLLFPRAGDTNQIQSQTLMIFPAKNDLRFDHNAGFETLQMILSPAPLPTLDAVAKQADRTLDDAQASEVARYWTDIAPDEGGISAGEQDGSRDPAFDKKKKRLTFRTRAQAGSAQNLRVEPVSFGVKLRNLGAGQ